MRLASLRDGTRDGRLVVVSRDGLSYSPASGIAPTLQAALDDWERVAPILEDLAEELDAAAETASLDTAASSRAVPLDARLLGSPLPRAYEWIDGSAYLSHVVRVRKARGAEPPETLNTDPLVYQGGSGVLLGPRDSIPFGDPSFGLDLEGELCVVLGDTPRATPAARAGEHVRLLMLANDVSLRRLAPAELAKGFGFFVSKPATAFAAFAVTPDELGGAWRDGRAHLRLRCAINGRSVADLETGPEMFFSFFDLIAHVTRTRSLTAGTILGGGTVSNADATRGTACLAERRALETMTLGQAQSPFLAAGDTVMIEAFDDAGWSPFGRIEQEVVSP